MARGSSGLDEIDDASERLQLFRLEYVYPVISDFDQFTRLELAHDLVYLNSASTKCGREHSLPNWEIKSATRRCAGLDRPIVELDEQTCDAAGR